MVKGVDMLCVPLVPSHQSTLQSAAGGRDNGSSLYQVCTLLSPPSPPAAGGSIHQHLPCSDAGILHIQRHFYCGEQWSGAGHTVTRITEPVLVLVTRLAAWLTTSAPEGDELYLQSRSCAVQTQTQHSTCCK